MASTQDHAPVIQELSERRQQQDPQSSQTEQPTKPSPTKSRDPTDSPRPTTSETLREPSPPRFSQLLDTLPEGSEPSPSRRGLSTTTGTTTLVNHPGVVSNPGHTTGTPANVTVGGAQSTSVVHDRNPHQSTSYAPDRRPANFYDQVRGESAVQVHLSDDGEHDNRIPISRHSLPRPRPVFALGQDRGVGGNGIGNGSRVSQRGVSGTDWHLDPQESDQPRAQTVGGRIKPTLDAAIVERDKYKKRARQQSLMINGAIGGQVIVGALTTGVAAASTNIGPAVAILGGISTALASYLAKVRGSGEPEFSTLRSRELSTFIREVQAFTMDHGHKLGSEFDMQIAMYRERFELIIKTEGEDSTSGTAYASHPRPNQPANFHPGNQQMMNGSFGGRQFQAMPPQPDAGGYGQPNEKQMWKNEKALSGMV